MNFFCTKEKVGHAKTIYTNSTAHRIKIIPFSGGVIDNNMVRVLPPASEVIAYEKNVRGKTIEPCFGVLLQPYDSVLVTYDDTVMIPHIKFNAVYAGDHKVLFQNARSISNGANYQKIISDETKYSLTGYFSYTFTEQDYITAKR